MFGKTFLNFLVIIVLTIITFLWTTFIFHAQFLFEVCFIIIIFRIISSIFIFKDYSLSWSKATQKTFLIKSIVVLLPMLFYTPLFYGEVRIAFMITEGMSYLVSMSFLMYSYAYYINKSKVKKSKSLVIFGAGSAGTKLESEYKNSKYKIKFFIDDNSSIQGRSIDSIPIVPRYTVKEKYEEKSLDLLVIAIPSAPSEIIKNIHNELSIYFKEVKVLPSLDDILENKNFSKQLKDISVEDLLARHPKDLDKEKISSFISDKTVLVTGAGGSIGSEICRQCKKFGAKKIILLDHSEFNLYSIEQALSGFETVPVMISVVNKESLNKVFEEHKPQIVIHAAAYKHVPLVEYNIEEGIINNVIGTKNTIDIAIKHHVKKFILISTDKAVRPTNVMGTTKRICELYAQNSNGNGTDIVAVRFGNVLGSSGSVIPKFKKQIEDGKNITVTHPNITRYFMLIPEACELVLQAGAIGKGGEIFILDMGEPIKIVDLAKKMIQLSGRNDITIEYTGLRPGEKLYEELLIDESDCTTDYESITVAKPTYYDIDKLNNDIISLLKTNDKLTQLKNIVPEFDHKANL